MNVLLNIGHTMLYRHAIAACRAAGLSPAIGFLHQGDGRYAALASDLQEPFRHLVERAVILATRMLKPSQFLAKPGRPLSAGPRAPRLHEVPRALAAKLERRRHRPRPNRAAGMAGAVAHDGPRPETKVARPRSPLGAIRTPMSLYVAAYDVTRDSRRSRVSPRSCSNMAAASSAACSKSRSSPKSSTSFGFRIGVLLAKNDAFDLFPIDRRFPKRRISWQRDPVAEDSVIVV